jgi:steroid delta-isomerase-like uncharacterized protein
MRNYRLFILIVLAVLVLAACQSPAMPAATPAQMDVTGQNMEVVRKVYDSIASGDVETFASLHANPFTLNYPGGSEEVDPGQMGQDLAALRNANPNLRAEIQDMYASGDLVVTQLTWRATHTGDLFGIPATGNPVVHNGVVVRRLEDGKVVESWETFDDFEFLHSLGILPSWEEVVTQSTIPTTGSSQEAANEPAGTYRVRLPAAQPDISAGLYGLTLNQDGSYTIDWAPSQAQAALVGVNGTYTVDGDQIVFTEVSGFAICSSEQGTSATYQWSLSGDGLILTPIEDACEARAYVFSKRPFERVP